MAKLVGDDGARYLQIGAVAVHPIFEMHYLNSATKLYPKFHDEPEAWFAQAPFMEQNGTIDLVIRSFVIQSSSGVYLVDAGVGNGKVRENPKFHMLSTGWRRQLEAHGYAPSDIEQVLFTHLHVDHVGWASNRVEDGWSSPTFENARYRIVQIEYDYWRECQRADPGNMHSVAIADSIEPTLDAGLVDFVVPDHRIDAEVRQWWLPGHTPGTVCIEIVSEGERAVLSGDVIHHAAQIANPDWNSPYCWNPSEAVRSRRLLLESICADGGLLVPGHFPAPVAGTVRSNGHGYRFEFVVSGSSRDAAGGTAGD